MIGILFKIQYKLPSYITTWMCSKTCSASEGGAQHPKQQWKWILLPIEYLSETVHKVPQTLLNDLELTISPHHTTRKTDPVLAEEALIWREKVYAWSVVEQMLEIDAPFSEKVESWLEVLPKFAESFTTDNDFLTTFQTIVGDQWTSIFKNRL
jgi:hypothetical protein